MSQKKKKKVLFLCGGNSCRSQMAEGWTRALHDKDISAYSAGTTAQGLNALAVLVMAEVGVDIARQDSKTISAVLPGPYDLVVTVCDQASDNCPIFPEKSRVHHRGFDDPPRLTAHMTDTEDILNVYRRVRDEIRTFVLELPYILENSGDNHES